MALSPEVCTAVGASGLDSSGGFRLPDVDSLDTAASELTTHAASFRSGIDAAAQTWSGLGASYVSEESPTVLAAFAKVSPLAAKVSSDAQLTSQALSAFSSTCRDLRQRLEAYGRSVRDLDGDIDAFPTSVEKTTMVKGEQIKSQVQQHWTGDADLTARHDSLAAEVKAIHDEYLDAQDTCAAAMATVSGAETYRSERIEHADLSSGNWVTEALFNMGTFFGIENEEDQNPWGQNTVPYRPNGVLGELQGFGAGAVMLVDGVWSLIPGVSNQTKHDRAVEGLKTLVTNPGSIDWGAVWSSAIHEDEAKTNPSWAGGANVFSVASLFIPGIGVGAKAGTVANKAGSVAGKIGTATADSSRLGKLSPLLGGAAHGLNTTGAFLSKPGSFAVKVSDLVMPQTTAKVLDALTAMKVKVAPSAAVPDSAGSLPDSPPDTAKATPAHAADDVDAADAPSEQPAADSPAGSAATEQVEADTAPPAPAQQDLEAQSRDADVKVLLSRSELAPDELAAYLKAEHPDKVEKFARTGDWPEEIQIPKDASVLTADGRIDWDQVPKGGYELKAGEPVKEAYVPEIGEVLDRYGPPDGRYTSPLKDGTPYSYDERSLPYVEDPGQYHQYVVTGDFSKIPQAFDAMPDGRIKTEISALFERFGVQSEAFRGPIAKGFGSGGGGKQVQLPLAVEYMKALGMIAEK
jgi:Tuberculosis necrotizing toxin